MTMQAFMQLAVPKLLIPTTQPSLRVRNWAGVIDKEEIEVKPFEPRMIRNYRDKGGETSRQKANARAKGIYDQLPEKFTKNDIMALGISCSTARGMLTRLEQEGLIMRLHSAAYGKTTK